MLEVAEVKDDDDADETLEDQEEFALREEVGLTGFPDEFGDFPHGFVHGEVAKLHVGDEAEQ